MYADYVVCIPLTDKSAYTVVRTYLKDIYCRFRGSRKILSDNGSEFKNSLFSELTTQLRIKCMYSSPYGPQANGKIKTSHKFFKNIYKIIYNKRWSRMGWSAEYHLCCLNLFPKWSKSGIGIFLNVWERCIYPYIWLTYCNPN